MPTDPDHTPRRARRQPDNDSDGAEPAPLVGRRLRALRQERGLTLRGLAERSDLSFNTLGLIEHGKTSPSVSTLQQLAAALAVPITAFFEEDRPLQAVIFNPRDLRRDTAFAHGSLQDLGAGIADHALEPFVIRLDPGATSGPCTIVHTGQEFVYCLAGQLRYTVAGQSFQLGPGDSLLFEAHLPHCWANALTDQPTEAILVLAPRDDRERPVERHLPPNDSTKPGATLPDKEHS